MKVLIACEFSQTVAEQFHLLGHEVMSCDLLPGEKGLPHHQGDVLDIINDGWDLMIAHPPCTYLSRAGARWLYPNGVINTARLEMGFKAKGFFEILLEAPIEHIAIENPIPQNVFSMPEYSQIIQPYQFGHEAQKATCLWLKNLPLLIPTNIVSKGEFVTYPCTGHRHAKWFMESNAKARSKTFPGIAKAMATQWSEYLQNLKAA